MNHKLDVVQTKFLEGISHISDAFGLNGFVAKLYGILYLKANPLSLDELAEVLGVSKGNVSINIRELENWGAVRKIWVRGSRKDYYEAESDIKKVLLNKLKSALQKRLSEVSYIIEEANKIISSAEGELSAEEKQIARGYQERLKKIEDLQGLVANALNLVDKLL